MTSAIINAATLTKVRVAAAKEVKPFEEMHKEALAARKPLDFAAALRNGHFSIIPEVKLASPSERFVSTLSAEEAASQYVNAGATHLSVVTIPGQLRGKKEYVQRIRSLFPNAPILMRDIFVDPYQIAEARVLGADAVAISAAANNGTTLGLLKAVKEYGLTAIVEVHESVQLSAILEGVADLVIANNRNPDNGQITLGMAQSMAKQAPKTFTAPFVAEGGLQDEKHLGLLRKAGINNCIIGTHLMRSGTPGVAFRALREKFAELLISGK